DVPPGHRLGGRELAVVMVDRAAAGLLARGDYIAAAGGQQFDRLAVDLVEHHAADAAGEEADAPLGLLFARPAGLGVGVVAYLRPQDLRQLDRPERSIGREHLFHLAP